MVSSCFILSAGRALWVLVAGSCAVAAFGAGAQQSGAELDLYSQVQSLQQQLNIQISGLEKIGDEPKVRVSGSLEQQLRQALAAYNHLITQDSKGQIEQIVILNKKQPVAEHIVLPVHYQDGHYLVSVAVSGNGKFWETLEMLVDTGSDYIVLPESMIANLGMADAAFVTSRMQTANGEVSAKVTRLQAVNIAGETLTDVEVVFIDDRQLGDKNLLGMSALRHYKVMIDNQSHTVTLFKKN